MIKTMKTNQNKGPQGLGKGGMLSNMEVRKGPSGEVTFEQSPG